MPMSPNHSIFYDMRAIQKHDIDAESQALLEEGQKEFLLSDVSDIREIEPFPLISIQKYNFLPEYARALRCLIP